MALVVLIENPTELTPEVETDMRRWWRGHCVKHTSRACLSADRTEVWFEVGYPVRYNVSEGVQRLASFGVTARAARRRI